MPAQRVVGVAARAVAPGGGPVRGVVGTRGRGCAGEAAGSGGAWLGGLLAGAVSVVVEGVGVGLATEMIPAGGQGGGVVLGLGEPLGLVVAVAVIGAGCDLVADLAVTNSVGGERCEGLWVLAWGAGVRVDDRAVIFSDGVLAREVVAAAAGDVAGELLGDEATGVVVGAGGGVFGAAGDFDGESGDQAAGLGLAVGVGAVVGVAGFAVAVDDLDDLSEIVVGGGGGVGGLPGGGVGVGELPSPVVVLVCVSNFGQ